MLNKNELARKTVVALSEVGIEATITDIVDVDNNTPLVAAVMTSGLVAGGMRGLVLDGSDLSAIDLDILVRASRGMHAGDAWIRGDLGNYIREAQYGGGEIPKTDINRLANQMGCSPGRLQNNMTTCATWALEDRYDSGMLSYTHHEELNALDPDARKEWAERAISESMSAVVMRKLLAEDDVAIVPNHNADGEVVSKTPVKLSEKVDEQVCIERLWAWYVDEVKKTTTTKAAFENVMHSFIGSGLVILPVGKWRAALALNSANLADAAAVDGDDA